MLENSPKDCGPWRGFKVRSTLLCDPERRSSVYSWREHFSNYVRSEHDNPISPSLTMEQVFHCPTMRLDCRQSYANTAAQSWCSQQFLYKIWSAESVVWLIRKKVVSTEYVNYRGINLFNIAYMVLSSVLCDERLRSTVKNLIIPYQFGLRPGQWWIIDQIFTIHEILENNE